MFFGCCGNDCIWFHFCQGLKVGASIVELVFKDTNCGGISKS